MARGERPLQIDLLSEPEVESALDGCTHVVNCSRGDDKVMLRGLSNLLRHCKRLSVQKFVHLSSVLVYGDPPSDDSVSEDGQTQPKKHSYGWIKLQQDKMVQHAARQGLPAVILCPPNIFGPYSYFPIQILNSMINGRFRVVDSGDMPCNTVDVLNLCHAIFLALQSEERLAHRYFITDNLPVCWADVVSELSTVAGSDLHVETISRIEFHQFRRSNEKSKLSILRSLKHLVSSDVREALRKDPLWEKFDQACRSMVAKLGSKLEDKARLAIEGPIKIPLSQSDSDDFDLELVAQQTRGVRHSCSRAISELGYEPLVTFKQSMAAFRNWYQFHSGINSEYWDLAKHLRS